ncbi:MAG: hotdog fold thioesterase, partial [Quisquiliibacterium sp.]
MSSQTTQPAGQSTEKAPELDQQQLAQACARIMFEQDTTAQNLGMEVLEVAPGRARLSMRVRHEFTNGHRICHGGYIFMLADTAFA